MQQLNFKKTVTYLNTVVVSSEYVWKNWYFALKGDDKGLTY